MSGAFGVTTAASGIQSVTAQVVSGATASHSLALQSDGTVWAWGNNGSGQLGNGNTSNATTNSQ